VERLKDLSETDIKFIFERAKDRLSDTLVAYREMTNKSYQAVVVYIAFVSYAVSKFSDCHFQNIPYYLVLAGMSASICFIFKNLLPTNKKVVGISPSVLIAGDKSLLEKDLMIGVIKGWDVGIKENVTLNSNLSENFKISFRCALVTVLVYLISEIII
jgi:hypothetical protein